MEVTQQQWDDMFAITTRGTFYTMRAAIRQMIDAGKGGTIAHISSVCAQHFSLFANAHYDAAKAGVEALTRGAAGEFAGQKVPDGRAYGRARMCSYGEDLGGPASLKKKKK